MGETHPEEGPKVVWTFPLVRAIQNRPRLLSLFDSFSPMESIGDISIDDNTSNNEKDMQSKIEEEINNVKESGSSIFEEDKDIELEDSSNNSDPTVDVESDVFVPTKLDINKGDTVTWTNKSNSTKHIKSISGPSFDSGHLEPGQTFEHTFNEDGVSIYVDTISGANNMSGAIIVGDATLNKKLPSEKSGPNPVTYEDGGDNGITMLSDAAEKKQRLIDSNRQ